MKKTLSYLLAAMAAVAFAGFSSCNNTTGQGANEGVRVPVGADSLAAGIVYIDMDRLSLEYDMANDLRATVENKVQNIQAEVNRRQKKLETDINSFQEKINKGLMTQSVAEAQAAQLQQQQQEFEQYAQQKNNEVNEELTVMVNQITDAVQTYVTEYNKTKGYSLILTTQGGSPIIASDPSLDITDEILAGLNEEYVKNKNKK